MVVAGIWSHHMQLLVKELAVQSENQQLFILIITLTVSCILCFQFALWDIDLWSNSFCGNCQALKMLQFNKVTAIHIFSTLKQIHCIAITYK